MYYRQTENELESEFVERLGCPKPHMAEYFSYCYACVQHYTKDGCCKTASEVICVRLLKGGKGRTAVIHPIGECP